MPDFFINFKFNKEQNHEKNTLSSPAFGFIHAKISGQL